MWITREVSLRAQSKWVRNWARYSFNGRPFVCSGNHDWWTNEEITDTDTNVGWLRKPARTDITSDNHGPRVGDVYFYCHSYAARAPFRAVETKQWILLHHAPPAGCSAAIASDSSADSGSSYLREQLSVASHAPFFVLSGHVHRPECGFRSALWCRAYVRQMEHQTIVANQPNSSERSALAKHNAFHGWSVVIRRPWDRQLIQCGARKP
jgi:hypothetical protein